MAIDYDLMQEYAERLGLKLVIDLEPVEKQPHGTLVASYLTIHNAGSSGNGKTVHDYNKACLRYQPDGQKDWHISVGEDGAYIGHALDRISWAQGPGNTLSISMEIGRDMCYDERYTKAEDNGAKMAAIVFKVFGWPQSHMVAHKHWMPKQCPHRILNEGRWPQFAAKVKGYLQQLNEDKPNPVTKPKQDVDKAVFWRVFVDGGQVGAYTILGKAQAHVAALKKLGCKTRIEEIHRNRKG